MAALHEVPRVPLRGTVPSSGPAHRLCPWVPAPGRRPATRMQVTCTVGSLRQTVSWSFLSPRHLWGTALEGRGTRSCAGHRQSLLGSPLAPPGLLSNPLHEAPPALPRPQLSLTVALGLSRKKAQQPAGSLLVLRVGVLCLPLPAGLGDAGAGAVGTALVGVGHLQDPGAGATRALREVWGLRPALGACTRPRCRPGVRGGCSRLLPRAQGGEQLAQATRLSAQAPPASTSSWPSKGAGTLPVAFAVPRPCQGGAGLAAVLRGRGRWFAARGAGVPHAAPGCHERPGLPRSSSSAPQLPAPPRPHGPGAAQGRRAVCAHGGKGERCRGACRGPGRGRCHREERAGRPGSCPLGRGHTRPLAARPFLWLPLSPLSSQLPWADPSAGKARPSPQLRETVLGEGLGQSRVPSELEMHQAPEPGRGQRGQLVLCQVPRTADSQGHWRTTGLRGAGPREARGP